MVEPFKVSQSKVKLWRKCRRAYHYKYVEKIKRRRKSRPLKFGTIVHSMLEAEANADNPFEVLEQISFKEEKLFEAEREMYGDIVNDIGVIMREYFDFWPEDSLTFIRKNKRSAEHEFEIEIYKGIVLTGKIDAVVKTPNGLKWLEENKSFGKQMPDEDTRWRNLQSVTYFRACDMLGWFPNLSGVLWNYVHTKPPTKPKLLKNGTLSKAHISTLPSVVRQVIKEEGLREKDYKDLIEAATKNRQNYFQRIFTPINKELVDLVFESLVDTAKEMSEYHGVKTDMNIDKHCSWCDYEPLCRATLTCSDVDFIKEREYVTNEDTGKKLNILQREDDEYGDSE